MKRRDFLTRGGKALALGTFAPGLIGSAGLRAATTPANPRIFVGTLLFAQNLYEEGIAASLDEMRERGAINTVMPFVHTHFLRQYRRGFGPAQDELGRDLTDLWVKTNPDLYDDPRMLGDQSGRLYAGRDILHELEDEAARRGMSIYARILEPYRITGAHPGFEAFAQIEATGETGGNVCFNHPGYMAFWDSVVTDLVKGHPFLAGFKFGQERGGPFISSLNGGSGTCFCPNCLKLAAEAGLDAEEARRGLLALKEHGSTVLAGKAPDDGHFVSLLRLLGDYPEVLAWEKFWMQSRENQRRRMYRLIKRLNPAVQVGWHMDHGMTWNLFVRAFEDYADKGDHSDWLSVALYFDSMGRRSLGHFERSMRTQLFGDADEKTAYRMYLSMLGYDPDLEPPLEAHREGDSEFSADYVFKETRRAVRRVNGAAKVYARIGFDMPRYDCAITPGQVYQATTRALDAGADGLWCGREWRELQKDNIDAFGRAVRDWQNRA